MSTNDEQDLIDSIDEVLTRWDKLDAGSPAAQGCANRLACLVANNRDVVLSALRASLPAPAPADHPDDLAVDRFATAMKAKLAKKRAEGRGGWNDREDCPTERLSDMLRDHVCKGDPLDVGNFAMMLHQRGDRIAPAPAAKCGDEGQSLCPACSLPAHELTQVPGCGLPVRADA